MKILILSPGKAATTFLASRIDGSEVIHSWRKNYYKASASIERKVLFIVISFIQQLKLLIKPHVLLLPWRPDCDSRKSFFWNDFEKNLYNYSTKHKARFRRTRYLSQREFLRDVYDHTEYVAYNDWLRAHFSLVNMQVPDNLRTVGLVQGKFGRSEIIHIDINRLEMLKNIPIFSRCDFRGKGNVGDEFWHSVLRFSSEEHDIGECENGLQVEDREPR